MVWFVPRDAQTYTTFVIPVSRSLCCSIIIHSHANRLTFSGNIQLNPATWGLIFLIFSLFVHSTFALFHFVQYTVCVCSRWNPPYRLVSTQTWIASSVTSFQCLPFVILKAIHMQLLPQTFIVLVVELWLLSMNHPSLFIWNSSLSNFHMQCLRSLWYCPI